MMIINSWKFVANFDFLLISIYAVLIEILETYFFYFLFVHNIFRIWIFM